jgi:hypothetical protein
MIPYFAVEIIEYLLEHLGVRIRSNNLNFILFMTGSLDLANF